MARFYPEDVRDDCLYTCDVNREGGRDLYTAFRVTARDGQFAWVVPVDAEVKPREIRLNLRSERITHPDGSVVTLTSYRDDEGRRFYLPEKVRELVAWDIQCGRTRKVKEAVRDLTIARRTLELGDRLTFDEIEPGVFKMRGFEVYASAHADRDQVAEIIRYRKDDFTLCVVADLDEARDWIAAETVEEPAVFTICKPPPSP